MADQELLIVVRMRDEASAVLKQATAAIRDLGVAYDDAGRSAGSLRTTLRAANTNVAVLHHVGSTASVALTSLTQTLTRAAAEADHVGSAMQTAAGKTTGLGKAGAAAGRQLNGLYAGIASGTSRVKLVKADLSGVAEGIGQVLGEISKVEKSREFLDRVLSMPGIATGMTKAKINEIVDQQSKATLTDIVEVRKAAGLLILSGDVTEKSFKGALELSARLSEVMGVDLVAAARLVAEVMADPVREIEKLRRVVVGLTETDKDQIRQMEEKGGKAAAQAEAARIVSERLGKAAPAGEGLSGRWDEFKYEWGKLVQSFDGGILSELASGALSAGSFVMRELSQSTGERYERMMEKLRRQGLVKTHEENIDAQIAERQANIKVAQEKAGKYWTKLHTRSEEDFGRSVAKSELERELRRIRELADEIRKLREEKSNLHKEEQEARSKAADKQVADATAKVDAGIRDRKLSFDPIAGRLESADIARVRDQVREYTKHLNTLQTEYEAAQERFGLGEAGESELTEARRIRDKARSLLDAIIVEQKRLEALSQKRTSLDPPSGSQVASTKDEIAETYHNVNQHAQRYVETNQRMTSALTQTVEATAIAREGLAQLNEKQKEAVTCQTDLTSKTIDLAEGATKAATAVAAFLKGVHDETDKTQEKERAQIFMTPENAKRAKYREEYLKKADEQKISLGQHDLEQLDKEIDGRVEAEAHTARIKEVVTGAKETIKGFLADVRTGLKEGATLWDAFGKAARTALDKVIEKLSNSIFDKLATGLVDWMFDGGSKGPGASTGSILSQIITGIAKILPFADGGIMTSRGPVPLRKYSGGGIATSPQLALFGEGSVPEAYVPVPSGRIPVELRGGGLRGGLSGGMTVQTNISVNMTAPAGGQGSGGSDGRGNMMEQARELGAIVTAMVNKNLQDQMRPGGLLNPSGSFSAGVVQ